MADILSYSASLSGFTGKLIEPEVVVTKKITQERGTEQWKTALRKKDVEKNKKNKKKTGALPSGAQKGRETAASLKERKTQEKSTALIKFWSSLCETLERLVDPLDRYTRAAAYALSLSDTDVSVVSAEATLYVCNTLVSLLSCSSKGLANTDSTDIPPSPHFQPPALLRFTISLTSSIRQEHCLSSLENRP